MGVKAFTEKLGRKLKGTFQPIDLFIVGTIIVFCFLLLWYVMFIMFPDSVPKFW
jgi:hypothetical protein